VRTLQRRVALKTALPHHSFLVGSTLTQKRKMRKTRKMRRKRRMRLLRRPPLLRRLRISESVPRKLRKLMSVRSIS
jgi:hypothetical protein